MMPKSRRNSNRVTPNGTPNRHVVGSDQRFQPIFRYISETVQRTDIVTIEGYMRRRSVE